MYHHKLKFIPAITKAAAFSASLAIAQPAIADLGDADIKASPSPAYNTPKTFQAKCGQSQTNCKIKFSNGKMIINDGNGIYKEQLTRVDNSRTCRQKSIILPFITSCYGEQLDYDYLVHYKDKSDQPRAALISFWPGYLRGKISQQKGFAAALNAWRNDPTPYMTKELAHIKQKELQDKCPAKYRKHDCSWSKYLKHDPALLKWAKSNPELAEEEYKKLNLLP